MSKFFGGPLDGSPSDYPPSNGSTYIAYMEMSGPGINTTRAPYRYIGRDGAWYFDSWGRPIVADLPRIISVRWDADIPTFTSALIA